MGNEQKVPTALDKSKLRGGKCEVIGCDCEFFAYHVYQDGFSLCLCGHTQHSHEIGEAHVD